MSHGKSRSGKWRRLERNLHRCARREQEVLRQTGVIGRPIDPTGWQESMDPTVKWLQPDGASSFINRQPVLSVIPRSVFKDNLGIEFDNQPQIELLIQRMGNLAAEPLVVLRSDLELVRMLKDRLPDKTFLYGLVANVNDVESDKDHTLAKELAITRRVYTEYTGEPARTDLEPALYFGQLRIRLANEASRNSLLGAFEEIVPLQFTAGPICVTQLEPYKPPHQKNR